MKKTLQVLRHEFLITIQRVSFIIFAFVIPVVAVLAFGVFKLVQGASENDNPVETAAPEEFHLEIEGFVDQSKLIQEIPENLGEGYLIAFADEDAAKQALLAGEINAYYLIPSDYMSNGQIFYVFPPDKSLLSDGQEWVMQWTLMVNLLEGDVETADLLWTPVWQVDTKVMDVQDQSDSRLEEDCSRPGVACQSNELVRFLPSLLVVLFYMSFMMSSSMLFSNIGTEKENRTIEVLLLSVSPRQLLAGKTLALASAGLLQTIVWLAATYALFNLGGQTLNLPENFVFPIDILVWGIGFFIGGYLLYASMMAGAGAMVPKLKEAGAASFIAMSPLMAGYIVGLIAPIAGITHTLLPYLLSFFPFTSPVVMVMRIANSTVPFWELLLSIGLLYMTAYLAFRAVAAMFHAQTLLSGQPFSLRRYFSVMLGRR